MEHASLEAANAHAGHGKPQPFGRARKMLAAARGVLSLPQGGPELQQAKADLEHQKVLVQTLSKELVACRGQLADSHKQLQRSMFRVDQAKAGEVELKKALEEMRGRNTAMGLEVQTTAAKHSQASELQALLFSKDVLLERADSMRAAAEARSHGLLATMKALGQTAVKAVGSERVIDFREQREAQLQRVRANEARAAEIEAETRQAQARMAELQGKLVVQEELTSSLQSVQGQVERLSAALRKVAGVAGAGGGLLGIFRTRSDEETIREVLARLEELRKRSDPLRSE